MDFKFVTESFGFFFKLLCMRSFNRKFENVVLKLPLYFIELQMHSSFMEMSIKVADRQEKPFPCFLPSNS